tara:strand:- start:59 stop:247 length:189 start_codon:yes stop_codon:yes gene_type:complete
MVKKKYTYSYTAKTNKGYYVATGIVPGLTKARAKKKRMIGTKSKYGTINKVTIRKLRKPIYG